jgi:hypothetical protein
VVGKERQPDDSDDSVRERFQQPFDNLIDDGRRRLTQVEDALETIDLQYRGRSEERSYRQFLTALRLANQAATEALTDAERGFSLTPEAAYDKARSLLKGISGKHERHVEALRSSRAESLEVLSQPFTRLAKRLLPNAEVLFFGWKLEGYELRVFDEERAAEFTAGAAVSAKREFGDDFQFLQFWHPVLRQSDLFQHAVFGHELAHPAIRQQPPAEVVAALGAKGNSPNYANVAVDFAHREVGAEIDHDHTKRLAQWFDEIACDIVGMRLMGPAFGLAFAEVTSVNWDFERADLPDRKRYPPTPMRLQYLREEMGRFTFPEASNQRLQTSLLQSIVSNVSEDEPDAEVPGASAWMEIAVEAFRQHCIEPLLNEQGLQPRELEEHYAEISSLIAEGIPPAERLLVAKLAPADSPKGLSPWSEEYDWRLILNVTRIGLLNPAAEGWELDRASACRMATAAIEMAEFQRRARKLRQQYRLVGGLSDR